LLPANTRLLLLNSANVALFKEKSKSVHAKIQRVLLAINEVNKMQPNFVYDKAKYHFETVQQHGLPKEHAINHAVFFLRWLIEKRLVSDFFEEETAEILLQFRQSQCSIHQIYEWWDCCLAPEMLSDEGNAFAMQYFDFEKGQYLNDYITTLQQELPTEFHITYNEANYQRLKVVIDSRYKSWSSTTPAVKNRASLTVIANGFLLTGLAGFVFAGLNFGTIGTPWLVLIIYFCTLYSLIAVPLSLVLYLVAATMRWRNK
jgi:hypothetical protein